MKKLNRENFNLFWNKEVDGVNHPLFGNIESVWLFICLFNRWLEFEQEKNCDGCKWVSSPANSCPECIDYDHFTPRQPESEKPTALEKLIDFQLTSTSGVNPDAPIRYLQVCTCAPCPVHGDAIGDRFKALERRVNNLEKGKKEGK